MVKAIQSVGERAAAIPRELNFFGGYTMSTLRSMLETFSEATCKLLLDGRVTLTNASLHSPSLYACEEYVDAIVSEVDEMPDDLQKRFLAGELTLRDVRRKLVDQLVEMGQFSAEVGRNLNAFSIDLGSIRSLGSSARI